MKRMTETEVVGSRLSLDVVFFYFKQKTAYVWRISDWSSDVCSSDLIEIPQAQGWTPMNIVRLERWKTVGIGKRPQSAVVRLVHARTSAGTLSGNQRRPNQKAALTSRISTGTSTSGPITAAKATGEASPKAAQIGRASCRESVCKYV